MTDEAFYLTPLDVRHYDFGSALRGYDRGRVEEFRTQVADELDRITRANRELEAKARGFHEQLKAFRDRDKALNDALVSAQQLRAETREQAERESQLVLREARAEAERIIDGARREADRLRSELVSLERARHAFVAQLRMAAERHLAEVNALASARPDVSREDVQSSAGSAAPVGAPATGAPAASPPASAPAASAPGSAPAAPPVSSGSPLTSSPAPTPRPAPPPPPLQPSPLQPSPQARPTSQGPSQSPSEPGSGASRVPVKTPAWLESLVKE